METGKNDEMLRQDFQLSHNRDPYFRTMEFHAHDFLELYYFLDGSVTYYIEDQVYDLCPGDLLIIPAGKMHRPVIANENPYRSIIINFRSIDGLLRFQVDSYHVKIVRRIFWVTISTHHVAVFAII